MPLRWSELVELAAIDPWPRFRVRWSSDLTRVVGEHVFTPTPALGFGLVRVLSPDEFASQLENLIVHAAAHRPEVVKRGWVDAPDIDWEEVSSMPEPPTEQPALGDGAFRAAQRPVEEVAIAMRGRPSPLEAMIDWLASSPDRPWQLHPREARLSAEYFYALQRDGSIERVARSTLRVRLGGVDEDAVYLFGRRAAAVLTHREGCPVRTALDAQLRAS